MAIDFINTVRIALEKSHKSFHFIDSVRSLYKGIIIKHNENRTNLH